MVEHVSIDGAGRLVIPKAIRRGLHLHAGSRLRISVESGRVVLEPDFEDDAIAEEDGLLVATGELVGEWTDHREIRARRDRKLTGRSG